MNLPLNTVLLGDALSLLKTLPSQSVDMCLTSPPYYGLRDYGDDNQLGLEPDFHDYITRLIGIFDEVERVLKKQGTCWVNMGDTYSGNKAGYTDIIKNPSGAGSVNAIKLTQSSIKDKSLLNIPTRFAIAMTERGWVQRNTIIWHKPSVMPQSMTDRFTVDFEELFFFTKSKQYYFKQQFEKALWDVDGDGTIKRSERQREGLKSNPDNMRNGVRIKYPNGKHGQGQQAAKTVNGFRNKRTVWSINTEPFAGAHFAVYPPKLLYTPIAAGCPEGGIVLDPFFGSGTTGLVADKMGRKWIGIELNPKYIEIAKKRLQQESLFNSLTGL